MKRTIGVLLAVGLGVVFGVQTGGAAEAIPPPAETVAASTEAEVTAEAIDPEGGGEAAAMSGGVPTDEAPVGAVGGPTQPLSDLLNFQTDLFTGRFTYRVPIMVPPARQNSQPTIGLGYNSSGGNGWCGVGWTLDMGFIQRETRRGVPRAWSGSSPANQYDDTYGFIFSMAGVNGRLTYISGANPAEYRLQTDNGSLLKFAYYPSSPYWLVTDKNGNKLYFGNTTDSRMQHPTWSPGSAGLKTFRWGLNRIEDANGNLTTLTYTTRSNQLYLSQIAYNQSTQGTLPSHTVDFELETGERADRTISFLSGYRVELRRRLQYIVVKASGQNVRKYSLTYTNSSSTARSLLAQVTQYGSDLTSSLPPLKFTYQVKPLGFGAITNWPGVYGQTSAQDSWHSVRATANKDSHVELLDLDADGFPDRIMRKLNAPYPNYLAVQRNTGTGFDPTAGWYEWGPPVNQGDTSAAWNSVRAVDGNNATHVEMVDINNDGSPDRILRNDAGYTNFVVQLSAGLGFGATSLWTGVTSETANNKDQWRAIRDTSGGDTWVDFLDLNGDGLPDRVLRKDSSPYNAFKVQLNTGGGFSGLLDWSNVNSQGDTSATWNSPYSQDGQNNTKVGLYDINGDGLPDRVMRKLSSPYDKFAVQFNNGAGFEAWEWWGGTIEGQGQGYGSQGWYSPVGGTATEVQNMLADINGDGLIDRVQQSVASGTKTNFMVQLNTGAAFTNMVAWSNVDAESGDSAWRCVSSVNSSGDTKVDLVDINGDGLPDRVMRQLTINSASSSFKVQLNQGPFPDLMSGVDNSLSGRVEVVYAPSTLYDNRDRSWNDDPWAEGAKGLLPFPVWTVSKIVVKDGFGSSDTNSYTYAGGMFDFGLREFNGFNVVQASDPVGTTSVTYFHQAGGFDDSANGEYQDILTNGAPAIAKRGIPYRTELYGSDGARYNTTLNKVEQFRNGSNDWNFAYIAQTIAMEHEGFGTNSYRATAKRFAYDFSNLTLTNEVNWGEVGSIIPSSHGLTDIGTDTVESRILYATLAGNGAVKPTNTLIYAGGAKLRETRFDYDARGNLTSTLSWLDTTGGFIENSASYDQYGNPTNTVDAARISTRTIYDTALQTFPVTTITETFTNQVLFDARSGAVTNAIDVKGLVVRTVYDIFYRPTNTYISTNAFGAAVLERSRTVYNLGGVVNGISYNYVKQSVNDPADTTTGFYDTYAYADGLGRGIQVRVEAETSNQFRVSDVFFNERGQVEFKTQNYFSTGSGFTTGGASVIGALTEYDAIGRVVKITSPASATTGQPVDDGTGSPVGSTTIAYSDGGDQWVTKTTDPENKVRKSKQDAYGRTVQVIEPGNLNTWFHYRPTGELTNVTDHANNKTWIAYDSLGRKTSMTDPDMGLWRYSYDTGGRLTNQVDAAGKRIAFEYDDSIGRLSAKKLYGSNGVLQATITYTYDTSDDGNYTVFKGQLYKVADSQGWQKNSYDVRGRVLKTGRYLNVNGQTYVTSSTYDDADRPKELTYPGSAARLQYGYDTGLNLQKVESLCGTSSNEVFYTAQSFRASGQLNGITYGNGLQTTFAYFTNTLRAATIRTTKPGGGHHQDLSYTYDKVSNVKSITDNVYAGAASAGMSSVEYDDLYRLKSYTRNNVTCTFDYNDIGNLTKNEEFGTGAYTYPSPGSARPHAVISANGKSYSYDACGNMTNRNGQVLVYDVENQLVQAGNVTFGYADGGARLWKYSGGQYTIFIGGLYEIKGGKTLCHVIAGGKRIATFEPISPFCAFIENDPWIGPVYAFVQFATTWPLQGGRAPLTATLIPLLGILLASVLSRCLAARDSIPSHAKPFGVLSRVWRVSSPSVSDPLARRAARQWSDYDSRLRPFAGSPFGQAGVSTVSVFLIVAMFVATMPTQVEAAPIYGPVFYYYAGDHLGSSNVLMDRQGERVDHFEYTAFGKQHYNEDTAAFAVSNRYTDQVWDDETSLYYYNARYYDPESARFIQADTIVPSAGDPQTLNRYSYVNNNPLKYTDPSGHFIDPITAVVAGVVIGAVVGAAVNAARGMNVAQGAFAGAFTGGVGAAAPDNVQRIIVQVGQAVLSVAAIVVGVMLLATPGAPAGGWLIAQGVLTIASGALSLGSQAAGLAGDYQLSQDLGYAAMAAAAAAAAAGIGYEIAKSAIDARVLGDSGAGTELDPKKFYAPPDEKMTGTGKADTALAFGSRDLQGQRAWKFSGSELKGLKEGAAGGKWDVYWHVSAEDLQAINANYKNVVYFGHGIPAGYGNTAIQVPRTVLRGNGLLVDISQLKGFSSVNYTCYQCYNGLWKGTGLTNVSIPLEFKTRIWGQPTTGNLGPAVTDFLRSH